MAHGPRPAVCWGAMTRFQKLVTVAFGLLALAAFALRMLTWLGPPPDRPGQPSADRPGSARPSAVPRPG